MNVELAYTMTPYERAAHAKAQNVFDRMMLWETGGLNDDERDELFQDLLNSGLVWQLQGSYGRTAQNLLSVGAIHPLQS